MWKQREAGLGRSSKSKGKKFGDSMLVDLCVNMWDLVQQVVSSIKASFLVSGLISESLGAVISLE